MRTLVATYAASRVMIFRRDKSFIDVVRFWGDFAADLVLGVDDGPMLDSGTLNDIKARTRITWGNSRRTNFFGA